MEDQPAVMDRILNDNSIAQSSYYYHFYLIEALQKAGGSGLLMEVLEPWEEMLELGLTTFAEKPDPTRSDCHAWSASPLYYFLSLVCGIMPAEPGFKKVRIAPEPGVLNVIEGTFPHRMGSIRMALKKDAKGALSGEIQLPEGLDGSYEYKGNRMPLKPGVNRIR